MSVQATLATLEANMREGDELMARVIRQLREHGELLDELEQLERYRSIRKASATSFAVEAAGVLRLADHACARDALLDTIPVGAWHQ